MARRHDDNDDGHDHDDEDDGKIVVSHWLTHQVSND